MHVRFFVCLYSSFLPFFFFFMCVFSYRTFIIKQKKPTCMYYDSYTIVLRKRPQRGIVILEKIKTSSY